MKKLLFISLFISSFIQADTYLFCKADKTLNPDFDRIEYSAIHIFKSNVEKSGYCQTELTYNPYSFLPKYFISPKLGKGIHCRGSHSGYGIERNADSYDWKHSTDLYTKNPGTIRLYQGKSYGVSDHSHRSLDRTSLILTESWTPKFIDIRTQKLKSQCEIVKSWGDLKKRFKFASKELIELQVKVNERIKEEESSRDKSENQKL
jgi:hypothetical protein